jgi:hypothetical protein
MELGPLKNHQSKTARGALEREGGDRHYFCFPLHCVFAYQAEAESPIFSYMPRSRIIRRIDEETRYEVAIQNSCFFSDHEGD